MCTDYGIYSSKHPELVLPTQSVRNERKRVFRIWENAYLRIENPNASTGLNNHLGLGKGTTERTKSFIAPSFASTSDSFSGGH